MHISHWAEIYFADRFREDLAASSSQVVILSPFVSSNRATKYFPVFSVLGLTGVSVDVFIRPKHEQPQGLLDGYDQVIHGLQRNGVSTHCRGGMHEKIGIIDFTILWHGSLNILSHNDTKESMLRIESPPLVVEVMQGIGLPEDIGKTRGDTTTLTAATHKTQTLDRCLLQTTLANRHA